MAGKAELTRAFALSMRDTVRCIHNRDKLLSLGEFSQAIYHEHNPIVSTVFTDFSLLLIAGVLHVDSIINLNRFS